MAESSLEEGREPPYALSEQIKAQWGPTSMVYVFSTGTCYLSSKQQQEAILEAVGRDRLVLPCSSPPHT